MPLILTIIGLLVVYLLVASYTEFFQKGSVKLKPKKNIRPDYECREYWTPQELNLRFLEIYITNENMAALDGHHNLKQFDNVVFPIVPHWYGRDQGGHEI
jgi:hypothetical protein